MTPQEILAKAAQAAEVLAAPEVHEKEMSPADYVAYAQTELVKALELPQVKRGAVLDVLSDGLARIAKAAENDGSQLMGLPVIGPKPAEGDPATSEKKTVADVASPTDQAFKKSLDGGDSATVAPTLREQLAAKTDWCDNLAARAAKRRAEAAAK